MLDWITKTKKKREERTQLYFYNDGDVEFRKLPVEQTELVEYANGKPQRWFIHRYDLEYQFDGFKNISADMVTLGFPRDVVYDVFDVIQQSKGFKKPDEIKMIKGTGDNRPWITERAKNARYMAMLQTSDSPWWDKVCTPLTIVVIMEAILFAIGMIIQMRGG